MIPAAIAAGIGSLVRRGVLVKGGNVLEQLGRLKSIVFDKTGTLTENKMTVTELVFSDQHVKIGPINNQSTADFSIEGQVIDP